MNMQTTHAYSAVSSTAAEGKPKRGRRVAGTRVRHGHRDEALVAQADRSP
jgi:hypothetical protein